MKVLWICHFSNQHIRDNLNLSVNFLELIVRKLLRKPKKRYNDYSAWISNGIEEFERFDDVELHVISPHYDLKYKGESFALKGINYHFFKSEDDSILKNIFKYITKKNIQSRYDKNRNVIKKLIKDINPDIIHMYGAENPYYSISAFDIDNSLYPFIVSLQTLINDPDFKISYNIDIKEYKYKSEIEKRILQNVKYIGSSVKKYREFIWSNINSQAIFLDAFLALEQIIPKIECEKKFDFVFFAAFITKHSDIAVEAFALACKKYPKLTLNIIGYTPEPYTANLKLRIKELGIENNIIFSGNLPSHQDVMKQIQLSKYALLPLKVDIISGTIREAIYAGLPVITNITSGTYILNEKRESILISEQNNFHSMADNMIKLIESPELCEKLTKNALMTLAERYSNEKSMKQLKYAYKAIINHHINNIPLPSEVGAENPSN